MPTSHFDIHPADLAEPLLQENKQRFVLFPIKHPAVWEMYKKAEASFWTAEEIDLAVRAPAWQDAPQRRAARGVRAARLACAPPQPRVAYAPSRADHLPAQRARAVRPPLGGQRAGRACPLAAAVAERWHEDVHKRLAAASARPSRPPPPARLVPVAPPAPPRACWGPSPDHSSPVPPALAA